MTTSNNPSNYKFLVRHTHDARDQYYNAVIEFEQSYIERTMKDLQKTIDSPRSSRWTKESAIQKLNDLKNDPIDRTLGSRVLRSLQFAEKDFNAKLERVADKLAEFGFVYEPFKIEFKVRDLKETHNRGLDFYIEVYDYTGDDLVNLGRVHARLVWVQCYDKASHWRFITTLKK